MKYPALNAEHPGPNKGCPELNVAHATPKAEHPAPKAEPPEPNVEHPTPRQRPKHPHCAHLEARPPHVGSGGEECCAQAAGEDEVASRAEGDA